MIRKEAGGYDWWVYDDETSIPTLGMTIGYGLVHEPVAETGALQRLAESVRSELGRAREIAAGQVSVPEVMVTIGPDTTHIAVRGDLDTVRSAWERLAELFAGTHPLEGSSELPVRLDVAPRDITSRFGLTSITLACLGSVEIDRTGDPVALCAHLNPSAGQVRCVMSTNSPELVGTAFAPPRNARPLLPEPSRLQGEGGFGFMQFPPGYALCSFVVPRTADGAAAIRVIGEQNAQLVGEAVGADGVHLSVVPVGPDMLATVMSSAIPSALQRERILKLLVSRQAPDTLVSAVVERERQMSSYSRTWERDALALGPDQDVSISGTRSALATAWSSLRLFTEPGMAAPPGFGEAIPPLAPAVGVRFRSRAGQDRIDVGPHHITSLRRGATRHGASRTSDDIENVDLEDLSLVLEDASGSLMLIDGQFRVLDVAVDVYRGSKRLRQLLDERTTGAPRLRVSNAANPGPMRERVKARRRLIWTLVLAPLGILAFAWIMSILDDTIQGTPNGSADSSYVSTALPWA